MQTDCVDVDAFCRTPASRQVLGVIWLGVSVGVVPALLGVVSMKSLSFLCSADRCRKGSCGRPFNLPMSTSDSQPKVDHGEGAPWMATTRHSFHE